MVINTKALFIMVMSYPQINVTDYSSNSESLIFPYKARNNSKNIISTIC